MKNTYIFLKKKQNCRHTAGDRRKGRVRVLVLHLTCDLAMQQQTHPAQEVRRSRQVQLIVSILQRLLPDMEVYCDYTRCDHNPVNTFDLLKLILKSSRLIFLIILKYATDCFKFYCVLFYCGKSNLSVDTGAT